jgi:hypothetical protein
MCIQKLLIYVLLLGSQFIVYLLNIFFEVIMLQKFFSVDQFIYMHDGCYYEVLLDSQYLALTSKEKILVNKVLFSLIPSCTIALFHVWIFCLIRLGLSFNQLMEEANAEAIRKSHKTNRKSQITSS